MKKWIVKNSDGSVTVYNGQIQLEEGQTLHKEVSSLYPLPKRDKFRSAWRISRGQVKINLAKARQIKKEELLKKRDEKVAANAAEFALKLSLAQDTSDIAEKQQKLANLEEYIDTELKKKKSASTIDSLDPFSDLEL